MRLMTLFSPSTDYNVSSTEEGRIMIWGRNLPLVLKRPWGYGAASSPAVDGMLAHGRYRALHNMYLEVLIELGIPGLIVFLLAFLVSWKKLLQRFRTACTDVLPPDVDREVRLLCWAMSVGLLAAAVAGFFLSVSYSNALWLMISAGGVLAAMGMRQPVERKGRSALRRKTASA